MKKKLIQKTKSVWQLSRQIETCQKELKKIEFDFLGIKLPSKYYSLQNKIKNLEKQLTEQKKFEFLAM